MTFPGSRFMRTTRVFPLVSTNGSFTGSTRGASCWTKAIRPKVCSRRSVRQAAGERGSSRSVMLTSLGRNGESVPRLQIDHEVNDLVVPTVRHRQSRVVEHRQHASVVRGVCAMNRSIPRRRARWARRSNKRVPNPRPCQLSATTNATSASAGVSRRSKRATPTISPATTATTASRSRWSTCVNRYSSCGLSSGWKEKYRR